MRNIIIVAGVAVAAVVGFAAYESKPRQDIAPVPVSEGAALPLTFRASRAAPATPVAPAPAAAVATDEPREGSTEAVDDGDRHETEQVAVKPLETPPPSREAFGADPASETAALGEARAILDGLRQEADPETRAQVERLLQAVDAPR